MRTSDTDHADAIWTEGTRTLDGLGAAAWDGTPLDRVTRAIWTNGTRTLSGEGMPEITASGTIQVGTPGQILTLAATGLDLTGKTLSDVTLSHGTPTALNVIDADNATLDFDPTDDPTDTYAVTISSITSNSLDPFDTQRPIVDGAVVAANGTACTVTVEDNSSAAILPSTGVTGFTVTSGLPNGTTVSTTISAAVRSGGDDHAYSLTLNKAYAGEILFGHYNAGTGNATDGSGNQLKSITLESGSTWIFGIQNDSTQKLVTIAKVGGGNLEAGPGGQGDQSQTVRVTTRGINVSGLTTDDFEASNGFVDAVTPVDANTADLTVSGLDANGNAFNITVGGTTSGDITVADTIAPTVRNVAVNNTTLKMAVTFSEVVSGVDTALGTGDWTLDSGITLDAVASSSGGRVWTFDLSAAVPVGDTLNYTGTAAKDGSNNLLAAFERVINLNGRTNLNLGIGISL